MLVLIIAIVAIISLEQYLAYRTRERETLTTLTGEYLPVGNPCTTRPCLPGIVYAVLVDDECYYITVEGSWIWENRPWDGYKPKEGDFVKVRGYIGKRLDVNRKPFYEIDVVSLKPA